MAAEITVVNTYALRDGLAFEAAVAALANRVEREGHPGVLSYRFYRPSEQVGKAVVSYARPEVWMGHHDLIVGWPETATVWAAGELTEIMVFGPVTDVMLAWLERAGMLGRLQHQGDPVAGFRR
jgi:hypothetical protein